MFAQTPRSWLEFVNAAIFLCMCCWCWVVHYEITDSDNLTTFCCGVTAHDSNGVTVARSNERLVHVKLPQIVRHVVTLCACAGNSFSTFQLTETDGGRANVQPSTNTNGTIWPKHTDLNLARWIRLLYDIFPQCLRTWESSSMCFTHRKMRK